MGRDNLIPSPLPFFLLKLFHMSGRCCEDGYPEHKDAWGQEPTMMSVHLEKRDEKPQNHEAVAIETIGVENNEEEWPRAYAGGWANSPNKVRHS